MTEFEMKCPHCGIALGVQDDWRGMELECPGCKQSFPVPSEPSASASSSASSSSSLPANGGGTFTFVCPSCGTVTELPESLPGRKVECRMCFEEHVAEATTERQCPFCGQTVKYHAAICKFCKADLTRTPPGTGNSAKPVQEEKFIFICPECDTAAELPLSVKGREYTCKGCCETSVAEPAEERKCPYCGEKIKIKAAVCKHCRKPVTPLTPSPAGGSVPSPMLAGLKSIGSRLSGGRQTPQMQPVGNPPPQMQVVNPASPKSRFALFWWNLVFPGAGQIYLGQTQKGIILIILFIIISLASSLAASALNVRLVSYLSLLLYAWIIGDSFNTMTKIELGLPVTPMEFVFKGKALEPLLTPEMKKNIRKYGIAAIVCLLLGINLPSIIVLICLIAQM